MKLMQCTYRVETDAISHSLILAEWRMYPPLNYDILVADYGLLAVIDWNRLKDISVTFKSN